MVRDKTLLTVICANSTETRHVTEVRQNCWSASTDEFCLEMLVCSWLECKRAVSKDSMLCCVSSSWCDQKVQWHQSTLNSGKDAEGFVWGAPWGDWKRASPSEENIDFFAWSRMFCGIL